MMATNITTALPVIYTSTLSNMDLNTADDVGHALSSQGDRDNRSSSLSEIGDRADQEQPDSITRAESDANDTEAETERLEDSPQKQRKNQNIVLTSADGIFDDHRSPLANHAIQEKIALKGKSRTAMRFHSANILADARTDLAMLERSSDISSLADSGEESGKARSRTLSSPKKRKRLSFEEDSSSSPEHDVARYKKAVEVLRATPAGSPLTLEEDASQGASAEEDNRVATVDVATFPSDESLQRKTLRPAPAKQKYKKGKRKGKRILDEESGTLPDRVLGTGTTAEHMRSDEVMSSNGEEAEVEEGNDIPEKDNAVRSEEGCKWLWNTFRRSLDADADCDYSDAEEDSPGLFKFLGKVLCDSSRQVR